MAIVAKGQKADNSYLALQLDDQGALRVTSERDLSDSSETIIAESTGAEGKYAKVPATDALYASVDATGYTTAIWRVLTDKDHQVDFYRAITRPDSVTLTLSGFTEADTIVINGATITGESTANTAAYATRKSNTAGGTDTLDATALAALINADYAVSTAGTSVAATDKLVITTDEGAHTIVAAATANYPNHQYGLNATAATEAASIIAAINHKDNVTCATASAGDTVTIVKDGTTYTFTGHATTTTEANREWDIADNNTAAAAIATCVNDSTYGVPGVTASASSAVVSFARDTQDDTFTLTTSNSTRLKTEAAGGVPGVIAAATGVSAELSITPTWSKVCTVTESGDRLTVTDIDIPGVYATSAEGVVTLVPGTPASQTEGDMAAIISASASAHVTISQAATLLGLYKDTFTTGAAADTGENNLTGGTLYEQSVLGYPYLYCVVTNTDEAAAATLVGVTLI